MSKYGLVYIKLIMVIFNKSNKKKNKQIMIRKKLTCGHITIRLLNRLNIIFVKVRVERYLN